MSGVSGSTGPLTLLATAPVPDFTSLDCGVAAVPSALVAIDLPAPGFPLLLSTCGSELDTTITVGGGCPQTNEFYFGCSAATSNDDGALPGGGFCSPGASVVSLNATTARVHVLVQGYAGATGTFSLAWEYSMPTPSGTPTSTPSPSQTGSPSVTPGLPPSQSETPTPRFAPPPSDSPSGSATRSVTPSNSPSPSALPNCFDPAVLNGSFAFVGRGPSGSSGSQPFAGFPPSGYVSGDFSAASPCAGVPMWPAPQARVAIDLGPTTPLGFGPLTISLCGPGTTLFDTRLYAGVGCPVGSSVAFGAWEGARRRWWEGALAHGGCSPPASLMSRPHPFTYPALPPPHPLPPSSPPDPAGCLAAADDSPGCGYRSAVSIPTVSSRYVYAIVTVNSVSASGAYNLSWHYTGPTPTPTPTRSNTPSRTGSATNTLPAGWSISNTASPSETRSASVLPSVSRTPSGTAKATDTSTGTPSPSYGFTETPTESPTATPTPTATPSLTASLSTGATPSETPSGLPPSASETPTRPPSPSGTPSRTPSASVTATGTATPLCGAMRVYSVSGLTGSVATPIDSATAGTDVPAMACPMPTVDSYGTIAGGGAYLVFRVDLGASTPIGGMLTVTTIGYSDADTVIFLGTSCPSSQASFGCLNGGDDDPVTGATQSITSSQLNATVAYVLVGGYGGAPVLSGLGWSYVIPTPSRTPTVSPTASLSFGATPSPTFTASRTITPTRSSSPTPTPTNAACSAALLAIFRGALAATVDDGSVSGVAAGSTGLVTMATADASTPSQATLTCTGTAGSTPFNRNKHWWLLDFAALGLRAGGTLTLETCDPAGTMNTLLVVGGAGSCPTTVARMGTGCWFNDNVTVGALPGCTSRFAGASGLTIPSVSLRALYVAVTLPNPTTFRVGSYNLRWTYSQPTPSNTPTSSVTPSNTASSSATLTPSASATISFGITPSGTGSPSGTGTPARTGTPSGTGTRTGTGTPTPTISPGYCAPTLPVTPASGLNSTTLIVMAASGPSLVSGAAQPCAGGGFALQSTPQYAIAVDLGGEFVPGGTLVATTADLGVTLDTTLYVGTGCPSSVAAFTCVWGSDDVAPGVYQSRVTLSGWGLRRFTVIASAYTGNVGTMFVRVSYVAPTPTPSGTASPSGTPPPTASMGESPSGTASSSASASVTATPTPSVDFTMDPSDTPSVTASSTVRAGRVGG